MSTGEIHVNGSIGSLRAYALRNARALRLLRSVKSQGQAGAYQDMGSRLIELEQIREAREALVEEIIQHAREFVAKEAPPPQDLSFNEQIDYTRQRIEHRTALLDACRKLAKWKPRSRLQALAVPWERDQ